MFKLFKPIPNFKNYLVDINGNIYSFYRRKFLYPNQYGTYLQYQLIDDNENKKSMYLHRILALTFLTNPLNLPCIDHIDRNPRNNILTNLRWVSHQKNRENSNRPINNKIGFKHICEEKYHTGRGSRFRLSIKSGSNNICKSYNTKNFTINDVVLIRNQLLTSLNLPIVD